MQEKAVFVLSRLYAPVFGPEGCDEAKVTDNLVLDSSADITGTERWIVDFCGHQESLLMHLGYSDASLTIEREATPTPTP